MSGQAPGLEGLYFDGVHPAPHPVLVFFATDPDRVRIVSAADASLERDYAICDLKLAPAIGSAQRFIALPDGGQLQCPDNPLLRRLPQESASEAPLARLERNHIAAIFGVVISIALLWGAYTFGMPLLAQAATAHIPVKTERLLMQEVMASLDEEFLKPSGLPAERQEKLRAAFAELTTGLPQQQWLQLEFRSSRFGANAFALPGGVIVMLDQMVEEAANDDEVIAVLAHEIAHVELRHVMRSILQNSLMAAAVAAITGDVANLGAIVVGLPVLLTQLDFSRQFESEADDYSFDLLLRHGRSPQAFADLMQRLAGSSSKAGSWSYLSSHPQRSERIAKARAAASGVQGASAEAGPGDGAPQKGDAVAQE